MPNNTQNTQLIPEKEKQPSKQGTGFVNLQKYLGANQNNKLGGAVAGNIEQAGQKAQQNLQQQQQQFGQGLQQARSGITQGQQNVAGVLNKFDAPNQFQGINDQDIQNFTNLRNQGYSGPTGFQNEQQLQQQAARAASLGQLSQSREGRQELLRGTIKAPQYTTAQQRLDELLLSQTGGAGQVRQAGQGIKQLSPNIEKQSRIAKSQGMGAQKDYQGLQKQAEQGVQSKENALQQLLQGRLGEYSQQQNDILNQARQQISQGAIQRDLANKIGLSLPGDEARFIQGFDPTAYLRTSAAPTMSAITNQDEAARLNALTKLTGQPGNFFVPNEGEIGTYDPNKAVSYRNEDLQEQINRNQQKYNTRLDRTGVIQNLTDLENPQFLEPDQNIYSYIPGVTESIKGYQDLINSYGGAGTPEGALAQRQLEKVLAKQAEIQNQMGYNKKLRIT